MGHTAHNTAHFCRIQARSWDRPRQRAGHAGPGTGGVRWGGCDIAWRADASAGVNNGEPLGFGNGFAATVYTEFSVDVFRVTFYRRRRDTELV